MDKEEIKNLIREEARKFLNESMDLYVKGADYDSNETLGDLSHKLLRPVWAYLEKLPPDQIVYFQKNKMPELLTPDGDGYFEPFGTLSLYISGLTTVSIRNVLKIILQGLKKLKIPYGQLKKEHSGRFKSDVIRIPIPNNPLADSYKGPPPLNMSNVTAYQIFHNVLQYEGQHSFEMEAKELIQRISTLAHDQGWIDSNIIKPSDSHWPDAEHDKQNVENPHMDLINQVFGTGGKDGPHIVGGGLDAERIRSLLGNIVEVAQWAIDHGFSELYVS